MTSWKKYIPDGTKDILLDECSTKNEVENLLRNAYINCGYHEVISPTIEFYDVFNMENQPIEQEKMYKLFDNMGRILVLRPDMTTPIARIAATKIKEQMYPLKLCYTSNIFRVNENLHGKLSEITQSGVEIIGIDNLRADVEVIMTGIKALRELGLENFKIEIGESQFFKSLIEDIALDMDDKEKLRTLIQNKNFAALREFVILNKKYIDEKTAEILQKLPELFGGKEVLEEASDLTINSKALKTLENLKSVFEIIERAGFSKFVSIDLGMVQHINYYTGLIFRGYCAGVGEQILSGGRYDKLIENFGLDLPATGFAINVDNVITALKVQGKYSRKNSVQYLIVSNSEDISETYKLSASLHEEDIRAEVSLYNTLEQSFEYAEKNGIKFVVDISNKNTFEFRNDAWVTIEYQY